MLSYVPGLPRLSGFANRAERSTYEAILATTRKRLVKEPALETIRRALGTQVRIGAPCPLGSEPDSETVEAMVESYLVGPTEPRRAREDLAQVAITEKRLESTIGGSLVAGGMKILKSFSPTTLYEHQPAWAFRERVPRLARLIRVGDRDVFVDGVSLDDPARVEGAVTSATARIGRAFWHYKRLREEIRRLEGRRIITVGMLFQGKERTEEAGEAQGYIEHVWKRNADNVFMGDAAGGLGELRERLREVLGAA
jgi:hypothetical protein